MTTVAYRDGILAADSCYTEQTEDGGSRQFGTKKIYEARRSPKGGYEHCIWVGFAGGRGWRRALAWLKAGADFENIPEFAEGEDFSAIVVETWGGIRRVYVLDSNMEPEDIQEPYHAIGSGAKCAFTAMDMGASAEEAVKLAARRDPYTRGPFVVCLT